MSMSTNTEAVWNAEDVRTLLDTIDAWVEKSVAPIAMEYDQEDKYPHHLVEEMKDCLLYTSRCV